jgi:antirestriction protein ArdC
MKNQKTKENKFSVAEMVTQKIIEKLEQGVCPWKKSWTGNSARNWLTQKPYRGINRWLLEDGEYITYNQCIQAKGQVKKGAKSQFVVFYKPMTFTNVQDDGSVEEKFIPLLRYSNVFNVNDCEGIFSKSKDLIINDNPEYETAETLFNNYLSLSNCKFETRDGSDRCFYSPSEDMIVMPNKNQFSSSDEYYSTLFHESVHSTGHNSRLKRLVKCANFGSHEYSKEELVAEIGSAILCEENNIDISKTFNNSVAYIQSWLKALKNDKNLIISASGQAEKAVDFINGRTNLKESV